MCGQFGGTMGERMKSVYGAFCSRHNDALQLYKALLKSDVTFQEFIKVRSTLFCWNSSLRSYAFSNVLRGR